MAKRNLSILFLLLLAKKSRTVGVDYLYIDTECNEEQPQKLNNIPKTVIDAGNAVKEGDALYHDKNRPESRKLFDTKKKALSTAQTSKATTTVRPTLTASRKHPYDVFLDYDYQYEHNNDNSNNNDTQEASLRQQSKGQNLKIQLSINANLTEFENVTVEQGDIYILEPVADQVDFQGGDVKDYDSITTWYVPERYPCWELPSVYGEIEKAQTNSEVFNINPYILTNVEVGEAILNEDLPERDGWQTQYNKWCGMTPCYGDHTLCVFPVKKNAQKCDSHYTVKVLPSWEEKALVNTLNSMRNHVAKGSKNQYPFLPPAANMKQVVYDYDLEKMARRWLQQCLPGPAPCVSLDNQYVGQLECTKYLKKCCVEEDHLITKCKPEQECFINPVIGCLHTWYWSAGSSLDRVDIECGHIQRWSYTLAQLLWANTSKIGCAYAETEDGDIRVMCNFAPGAPFSLETKFFCGFILLQDEIAEFKQFAEHVVLEPVEPMELNSSGISVMDKLKKYPEAITKPWGVMSLSKTYKDKWIRAKINEFSNGTIGMMARLVTRYKFREETNARCDNNEPVYMTGDPGAMCTETGRKYSALCYEYRDPTPTYRLVAIIASIALFSLILYDLFSGVMRQLHT